MSLMLADDKKRDITQVIEKNKKCDNRQLHVFYLHEKAYFIHYLQLC